MAIIKKWEDYQKENYVTHDTILKDIIREITDMERSLMMLGGALVFQSVLFVTYLFLK